jgi:hypothetical protein
VQTALEEVFYNVEVTDEELWVAVGQTLQRYRLNRKWRPIDVERNGGPTYKTVQTIEAGDAGTVESLGKYARALGLECIDILTSIIDAGKTPLTPEAAHVVRKLYGTTVAGRTALLGVSDALPWAAETTGPAPIPGDAGPRRAPRPPRPGPRGVTRRTAR